MTKDNTAKSNQQVDSLFFAPARAYASLMLDYSEKLMSAQLEAYQTYSNAWLSQTRALFSIKDADGMTAYIEDQKKVARDLGEQIKGDAEKVVALNQEFAQKGQKLVEDNVKSATQVTTA